MCTICFDTVASSSACLIFIYCLLYLSSAFFYCRTINKNKNKFNLFIERVNGRVEFSIKDIVGIINGIEGASVASSYDKKSLNLCISPGITFLLEEGNNNKISTVLFKMLQGTSGYKSETVCRSGNVLYLNTALPLSLNCFKYYFLKLRLRKSPISTKRKIRHLLDAGEANFNNFKKKISSQDLTIQQRINLALVMILNSDVDLVLINGLNIFCGKKDKLDEDILKRTKEFYQKLLDNNIRIVLLDSDRGNMILLDDDRKLIDNVMYIYNGEFIFSDSLKRLKFTRHNNMKLQNLSDFFTMGPSQDIGVTIVGNGDDLGEAGGGDVLQQKTRSLGGKGTPNNGGVVKRC